jgi:hypothetical protein
VGGGGLLLQTRFLDKDLHIFWYYYIRLRRKLVLCANDRVGRVLSFFFSRRNWDSPTPYPLASVPPSPRFWGEGLTRWRERGWESTNSDERTYTVVLFIYTYFVTLIFVLGENLMFVQMLHARAIYISCSTQVTMLQTHTFQSLLCMYKCSRHGFSFASYIMLSWSLARE